MMLARLNRQRRSPLAAQNVINTAKYPLYLHHRSALCYHHGFIFDRQRCAAWLPHIPHESRLLDIAMLSFTPPRRVEDDATIADINIC